MIWITVDDKRQAEIFEWLESYDMQTLKAWEHTLFDSRESGGILHDDFEQDLQALLSCRNVVIASIGMKEEGLGGDLHAYFHNDNADIAMLMKLTFEKGSVN